MSASPDMSSLPPSLRTVVQPWLSKVESEAIGSKRELEIATLYASNRLIRRAVFSPEIERALIDAITASSTLGRTIETPRLPLAEARGRALAALAALIEALHQARPRAVIAARGLGW